MLPARIRRLALTMASLALMVAPAKAEDPPALAVCRALQQQYAILARANERRDLPAILALRTPDSSTQGPGGQRSTYAGMAEHSRRLVSVMRPPIQLQNTIVALSVQDDMAVAEVLQGFSRRQLIDTTEQTLETSVLQRERWRRTPDGWRLEFVDDVHDRRGFAGGKRVDPDKPYDPKAPAFTSIDVPRPEKTTDCGLSVDR